MMQPVKLNAMIDENHRLVIDVPKDVPPGPVEVIIRPVANGEPQTPSTEPRELTREEARAKLRAAGLLVENEYFPELEGFEELSEAEEERLAKLFAGNRPLSELIDEDREERF
jgi:hypothetical protein